MSRRAAELKCLGLNDNAGVTTLLDSLIEKVKDGEEGFRTAAQDVDTKDLRDLFTSLSAERASFVAELQGLAKSLGENQPETEGSFVGTAHRGWIDLRAAVATQNAKAILDECERGEDSAVAAFGKALEGELPSAVRVIVANQFVKIQAARKHIQDLRGKAKIAGDQQARW